MNFKQQSHQAKESREGQQWNQERNITQKVIIRTILQVQGIALEVYLAEKGKRTICSIYLFLIDQVREDDLRDLN